MQDSYDNDKKKLLSEDANINKTANQSNSIEFRSTEKKTEQKKKTKIYVGAGIGAAIAIALIVTLSVTLTGEDITPGPTPPNPPGPGPQPGPPIFYNDYSVSENELVNNQDSITGYIIQKSQYNPELHAKAMRRLTEGLPSGVFNNHLLGTNPTGIPAGVNNQLIQNVSFQFSMSDYRVGYMKLTDAKNTRYSVPTQAVGGPGINGAMRLEMLGFQLFTTPFSFSFTDVTDKDNVFVHMNKSSFIFMDKYIQMDLQLPSQRVYGLGERVREFQLQEGTWTMWAKGADSPYDDGRGGKQVYGVHPFVLVQGKKKGNYFGIFFRNSNAQSPLLRFNMDSTSTLSYITTGGMIEAYFFIQGSAKTIIQQYHNIVGKPTLPPFWSLGWQQASWKYENQSMVEDVMANYKSHDIPLDVMWLDIPYMDGYADFSVNKTAFPDIKGLATNIHNNNQKLVVILDAGLSADNLNNPYYKAAQQYKILIQSSINKGNQYDGALVMKVWPNATVFLDWFHKDTPTVWNQGLNDLYAQVPFDGLWLDMSEATGFCNGECPSKITTEKEVVEKVLHRLTDSTGSDYSWYYSFSDQSQQSTYNLPFIPGYNNAGNLDNMAMSLNATHPSNGETEYNLHSLYGLMMSKTTQAYLTGDATYPNKDDRPFILTRSTFSGSGQYTSHWLGDNWREWRYMNYSIAGIMNMNMFGIPHSGADVCGFFGEKRDDEMCARWIQLATFYPFARAHQNLTWMGNASERSEPYYLEGNWINIARASIKDRYRYLRHLYTCLFEANQWGGTCFDPLFFYFPQDDNLYKNIEESFLVGGNIKVSPILNPGVEDNYTAYFPAGIWVNIKDPSEIIDTRAGGQMVTLKARDEVNAHLRQGSIIPYQDSQDYDGVYELVEDYISLVINRDSAGSAYGTVFLDGGISRSEISNGQYEYWQISHTSKTITNMLGAGTMGSQSDHWMHEVRIVNAQDLADTNFACYMDWNFNPVVLTPNFDTATKTLKLQTSANVAFNEFKVIYYGNTVKDINLCNPYSYQYNVPDDHIVDLSGPRAEFELHNNVGALPDLNMTLQMIAPHIVQVRWSFFNSTGMKTPFEVPKELIDVKAYPKGAALEQFVTITYDPYFQLSIKSQQGDTVFDLTGLVFDEYINIMNVTVYQDKALFKGIMGLGERATPGLFFEDGVYSMWSMDTANPIDDGKVPGKNLYGTHPFYMYRSQQAVWTGVYTNLAAAQDWYIKNDAGNGAINVKTVAAGGVADLYIIVGYNPKQIVADYHNYIVGRPVLIPVYALGWNQCRWGYTTLADAQAVVDNYKTNGIPLDNMWSDIDYLYSYRDFSYDDVRYQGLPQFIDTLHANGQQYVPIIDAGIAMRPWGNYDQYTDGKSKNVFVKQNSVNPNIDFIGYVWPNQANYPDWFNPNTTNWWIDSLASLHDTQGIEFDGLWLDMNEASNFCNGPCFWNQVNTHTSVVQNLKYIPTGRPLEVKSMQIDAYHYGGILEFDAHSTFGALETMNAFKYFQKNKKRTFIIERSSFAGMGKYGSVWLGDNFSDVKYLESSIAGVMMMNVFGIPLAGADICGFIGDTTPELCARWTVAGAFYPFSRNHNGLGWKSQEPYQFKNDRYEEGISFTDVIKQGIINKYHMIKYYYTQLFQSSVFGTGSFFNPLFFSFPDDVNAYEQTSNNIMLGGSLKLSVLTNALDQNMTDFYFPAGIWCNIFTPTEPCMNLAEGETKQLSSKAYDFYVHLFESHIVPMQDATTLQVTTTAQLTNYPVDFHILGSPNKMGESWYAQGSYINDDGITLSTSGNFNQYSIVTYADTQAPSNIIVDITQKFTAYNYKDKSEGGCNAVNKNDYLGNLYIYNANTFGNTDNYDLTVTWTNGTTLAVGTAAYDATTDRVVTTLTQQVCLTAVNKITFAPQP